MSTLDKVRNILNHFEVTQSHNVYVIKKLEELEQSIINELEVKL